MITYQDAVKYLDTFADFETKGFEDMKKGLDLERVKSALKKLGRPDGEYPSIHIAGTKGKGSVSAFTASILREAGYSVGLFTSPHLSTPRERIQVDGQMISETDLAGAVATISQSLGPDAARELTYFEIYTLLAMLYFKEKKADVVVFETGLGGRLDATNVIQPRVSAITPISYDHTHVLGSSLEKIAAEKAAIIKKGSRCVSSPQEPKALEVIEERCAEVNAPLILVGADLTYKAKSVAPEGSVFDILTSRAEYRDCRTIMPGEFQMENASCAVAICEEFFDKEGGRLKSEGGRRKREGGSVESVKRGIEKAFLPGRLEVVGRSPIIAIDGAQNAASAGKLKYSVEHIFKYDRLIILLGLSRDKDIKGVCSELMPLADEFIITKSAQKRAADPEIIRGYIKEVPSTITRDAKEALGLALAKAGKKDMILATGSFYLIGEIRELILGKKHE